MLYTSLSTKIKSFYKSYVCNSLIISTVRASKIIVSTD